MYAATTGNNVMFLYSKFIHNCHVRLVVDTLAITMVFRKQKLFMTQCNIWSIAAEKRNELMPFPWAFLLSERQLTDDICSFLPASIFRDDNISSGLTSTVPLSTELFINGNKLIRLNGLKHRFAQGRFSVTQITRKVSVNTKSTINNILSYLKNSTGDVYVSTIYSAMTPKKDFTDGLHEKKKSHGRRKDKTLA